MPFRKRKAQLFVVPGALLPPGYEGRDKNRDEVFGTEDDTAPSARCAGAFIQENIAQEKIKKLRGNSPEFF